MKNYKLLLFDLDGTIVNSMYDIGDAMNYTFRHFGKPEIPYSDIPALVGSGIKPLLREGFGSEMDLESVFQIFNGYYSQHYVDKTQTYPGVVEALEQLSSISKGIYSNKPHLLTNGIIDTLALKKHFIYVQGARPELYPSKPNPEGINHILDILKIEASETLFIGDSTHDILAGKAAGTDTCAVTYGYRSKEVLLAEKPDYLIDTLLELV